MYTEGISYNAVFLPEIPSFIVNRFVVGLLKVEFIHFPSVRNDEIWHIVSSESDFIFTL